MVLCLFVLVETKIIALFLLGPHENRYRPFVQASILLLLEPYL